MCLRNLLGSLLVASFAVACGSGVTGPEAADTSGAGGSASSSSSSTSTGGPTGCVAPADAQVFEIGTGEDCFERVEDGGEIPLVEGPQGGYHLWLAVGCGDCSQAVQLSYGARDPATGADLPGTYPTVEWKNLQSSPWRQVAGITVYMPGEVWDPEAEPPPAKGTHLVLWVQVLDNGNIVHSDEVEVVIGDSVYWDPCDETPNDPECGQLG